MYSFSNQEQLQKLQYIEHYTVFAVFGFSLNHAYGKVFIPWLQDINNYRNVFKIYYLFAY